MPRSRAVRQRAVVHGGVAWAIGLAVLVLLGVAVAVMFRDGKKPLSAHFDPGVLPASSQLTAVEVPLLQIDGVKIDGVKSPAGIEPTIRGIVLMPDGQPAGGATVTVYRALTAWPEWRREPVDRPAYTGADGVFEFRIDNQLGLLVGVEHSSFAGDLVEVPRAGVPLDLHLQPGFELRGTVVNDVGELMRNTTVTVESVPGDQRRSETVTTSEDGRYTFTKLRAGPVRIVAHHEAWQPATEPAIIVGDQRLCNLRFDRRRMPPLHGRVISVSSQAPIEGALVQLLPINQKLGFTDPISARSGADGTFQLDGLPRGSMRLFVRHPDYGGLVMTQTIGSVATDLLVEMPARSIVQGRIESERGSEPTLGGAVLEIIDTAGQVEYATVEDDGSFRFAQPLSPGSASLRVLGPRFVFQRGMTSEQTVRIDESATTDIEQRVALPTRLRGRVIDDAGRALAGVVLTRTRLLTENARLISDAAFQLDLRAVGNQVAQLFGSDRDEVLAVSAADGSFEIRSDEPGPLVLRLTLRGYGSRLQRLVAPSSSATVALGDYELTRGCRLQGMVLRGNRGLTGAVVTASGGSAQGMAVTGAEGQFVFDDLVAGDYRVVARLPSLPNGTKERTINVGPEKGKPEIIMLDAGRTVHGVVTGSDGQPLAGVFVGVRGTGATTTTTDVNGDFLLDLPDRAVELQMSFGDRGRTTTVPVPLGQERVEVTLDTPPTCTLVAQVAGMPGPSGQQRVRAALLRAVSLDDDGEVQARRVELNDGELRWTSCPVGRLRLEIWCEGFAPFVTERVLVKAEVNKLGDVLLETGCRLRGVVVDESKRPVANAGILLGDETDLDLLEPRTVTAADGTFQLDGISSRSSHLVVRASGWATRTVDINLPRDVLAPQPLLVKLERGTTIQVSVPADLARETGLVQLRRQGRVLASAVLDDQGSAWFANRCPGTYSVQLLGSSLPAKQVSVPAGVGVVSVPLP